MSAAGRGSITKSPMSIAWFRSRSERYTGNLLVSRGRSLRGGRPVLDQVLLHGQHLPVRDLDGRDTRALLPEEPRFNEARDLVGDRLVRAERVAGRGPAVV